MREGRRDFLLGGLGRAWWDEQVPAVASHTIDRIRITIMQIRKRMLNSAEEGILSKLPTILLYLTSIRRRPHAASQQFPP
jgi:hypothetical protein